MTAARARLPKHSFPAFASAITAAAHRRRGYKTVLRFFPNDVASFEPVVALLEQLDEQERAAHGGGVLRMQDGESLWEAQVLRGSCVRA